MNRSVRINSNPKYYSNSLNIARDLAASVWCEILVTVIYKGYDVSICTLNIPSIIQVNKTVLEIFATITGPWYIYRPNDLQLLYVHSYYKVTHIVSPNHFIQV